MCGIALDKVGPIEVKYLLNSDAISLSSVIFVQYAYQIYSRLKFYCNKLFAEVL